MKKVALIFFLVIFGLVFLLLVNNYHSYAPRPISFENRKSIVLTNTALLHVLHPSAYLNFLLSESKYNPYLYGWQDGNLYFKDAWNRDYKWNSQTKEIEKVALATPSFLRQEESYSNCNPENKPDYSSMSNLPGGIEAIGCRSLVQGNVRIESWPKVMGNLLAFGVRDIVIEYDGKKFQINEPRLISDIVISDNEKYVAFTVSNPQSYPDGFALTDVHVIELP